MSNDAFFTLFHCWVVSACLHVRVRLFSTGRAIEPGSIERCCIDPGRCGHPAHSWRAGGAHSTACFSRNLKCLPLPGIKSVSLHEFQTDKFRAAIYRIREALEAYKYPIQISLIRNFSHLSKCWNQSIVCCLTSLSLISPTEWLMAC